MDIKKILDESEETWVDDIQLRKDTRSKQQSDAIKGRYVGKTLGPSKYKGIPRDEEVKDKIREKRKEQIFSEETREKMSKARLGKKMGPMPDETKKKLSEARKGKPGRAHTEEHKEKMRQLMTGNKFNKPKTDEQRRNLSIKGSKYDYTTPKGIFYTRKEMLDAYPELSKVQLEYKCKREQEGFSRKLKDD